MDKHIKVETSFSKTLDKISMAQREMYSNTPFALKLLIVAEKDLERAKLSLRTMIDTNGRQKSWKKYL